MAVVVCDRLCLVPASNVNAIWNAIGGGFVSRSPDSRPLLRLESEIVDLRGLGPEVVRRLKVALARGAPFVKDRKRRRFYEVQVGREFFFIHVLADNRVLVLARWTDRGDDAAEGEGKVEGEIRVKRSAAECRARERIVHVAHLIRSSNKGTTLTMTISPDAENVRKFLRWATNLIGALNSRAGIEGELARATTSVAAQSLNPAYEFLLRGDQEAAQDWLVDAWEASALSVLTGGSARPKATVESAFNLAVAELLSEGEISYRVRQALARLKVHLEVSPEELGLLVGVSGSTIGEWERDSGIIPKEKSALLVSAASALNRLLNVFRAETLPHVIRRPAELFDGERALDWILRGQITEVVGRYESALQYR